MNKLTKIQYWQAHASAQQLAAEGSGFEAALAAVFFKADLYNAAALVAAFPQLFTIEAAPIEFVVRAIYQDDPKAFANTVGRFDTEEAAKAAAAQFEDQEDAPNFMSCDIIHEAAEDEAAPDHWQIDEDLPSSYNSAGSDRNGQY